MVTLTPQDLLRSIRINFANCYGRLSTRLFIILIHAYVLTGNIVLYRSFIKSQKCNPSLLNLIYPSNQK